jgi:hypothetical protein
MKSNERSNLKSAIRRENKKQSNRKSDVPFLEGLWTENKRRKTLKLWLFLRSIRREPKRRFHINQHHHAENETISQDFQGQEAIEAIKDYIEERRKDIKRSHCCEESTQREYARAHNKK